MALDTMHDLLIEQLRDLHSAERQIFRALPKLADGAANGLLAEVFRAHLRETEGQIVRLDRIFDILGESPKGMKCRGMEGLLKEGAETLEEAGSDFVKDAALIADAQRVEHYEISAYGTARALARLLEQEEIATLLEASLLEEVAADEKLGEIAETDVNPKGMLVADPEASRA